MGGVLQGIFDILILAVIAAFLAYRLYSTLGKRTGHEPPPNSYRQGEVSSQEGEPAPDNVVTLPQADRRGQELPQSSLAAGLTQLKVADPSFDQRGFLEGAQAAFGMIVDAFARGDTAALRPLLSDELYDEFSAAIRERMEAGEVFEHVIEDMRDVRLTEAKIDGRTAIVTVQFTSAQRMSTRDGAGELVDGDPDEVMEVVDLWTFARNTRSTDPTWTLVATDTPDSDDDDADEGRDSSAPTVH